MEFDFIITQILHRLGICRNYSGFDYIVFAMNLIERDRDYLCYITKSLYIDIAKEFATTHTCVEKNIRTIVNKIWEKSEVNEKYIIEIFGDFYMCQKPSNKEFLELLYDYATNCKIVEKKFDVICPMTNATCTLFGKTFCLEIRKE